MQPLISGQLFEQKCCSVGSCRIAQPLGYLHKQLVCLFVLLGAVRVIPEDFLWSAFRSIMVPRPTASFFMVALLLVSYTPVMSLF